MPTPTDSLAAAVLETLTNLDRELLQHDISLPALVILLTLQEAPATGPTALAAALGRSTACITDHIQKLVRSGHLTRHPDPADQRRALLRPTAAGHKASMALLAAIDSPT